MQGRDPNRPLGAPVPARLLAVFYLLSAGFTIGSFLLLQAGVIALAPRQAHHFQQNAALEQALHLLTAAAEFSGAIALLRGSRQSCWCFILALASSLLLALTRGLEFGLFAALGGAGIFATLFGWGLLGAVCVYTWRWRTPVR